jgi:myo-inositol 2-dehydrogenase/D-chiro-inositol 1-dehydrogenase
MNIGVIGCGVMGGTHLRAYRALGQNVAAVADADAARAEALACECGCRPYTNLDAMLDAESLDAVSLCTPTFDHLKSIERIAARRIPMLCEKPLALTLPEARAAYRAVKNSGISFMLGFKMRYESVYQEAVKLVRSSEIGPVRHVFISHFQPLSEPAWYMDNGVTAELLIHSIDKANLLMGGVPERVVGEKGKVKRIYRWYATPWEILRQLPGLAGFLKPDLTEQELNRQAGAKTDLVSALEMQEAKRKLFASFQKKRSA